jgi:hypothetical protein
MTFFLRHGQQRLKETIGIETRLTIEFELKARGGFQNDGRDLRVIIQTRKRPVLEFQSPGRLGSAMQRQSIAVTRAVTWWQSGLPNNSIGQTTQAATSVRSSGGSRRPANRRR